MKTYLLFITFFLACINLHAATVDLSFTAPQDFEKISDDVVDQFKQLIEFNRQNDLRGESHKNKYVLNYVVGQSFSATTSGVDYVQQHTFNNQTWTFPWPDDDMNGTFDLEDDICAFNINANGKNLFNIRKYAILFGLPSNKLNTLLTSDLASQSAIVPYMVGTNAEANKTLFLGVEALIENKIRTEFNDDALIGANEKIITVSSYFKFKKPWSASTYQDTRTRTFFIQTSTLTQEIFNNYLAYSNAIVDNFSKEKFTGTLYQRLKGFVEFFENPISYNTDFDACSLEYIHQISKDVRDCYCANATSLTKKQFLTNVCLFVDNNHFVSTGGTFLNPNIQSGFNCTTPTSTWLNTVIPEFFTYETNNPGSDGVNWVLQSKIMTPSAANVKIESVLFWFVAATDLDFRNLSPSERFKLISVCRNKFPGGTSGINTDNGVQATMTRRIYETVYNGIFMDVQEVESFLNLLKGESGLVEWLYEKVADNWTTWEADEHQVVAAFNHLVTYMNGWAPGPIQTALAGLDDKAVSWKPSPWWWDFAGHYIYANPEIDVNGNCTFLQRYINAGDATTYFTDTPWSESDPFKLIMVGGGEDVSWATDCSNGGNGVVGCGKIVWIPAASLIWYLEKLYDGQVFDAFVTVIEVASMAIGGPQFIAIMRVAGTVTKVAKARKVLYGFSLAADIADLTLPNLATYLADLNGADTQRLVQIKEQIRGATAILAITGGVGQVGDMFVGLAKYRRVSKLIGAEDDVAKVMDDVTNFMTDYPDNLTLTEKLCHRVGITNENAVSDIKAIANIQQRISVIGAIRQSDEILELVDESPGLVKFFRLSMADDVADNIHTLLLSLDDTRYLRLLNDMVAGTMIDAIADNLDLLRAWDFLNNSPNIRKNLLNLQNMLETLNANMWDEAGVTYEAMRTSVNTSTSKAAMITRLSNASTEGSSVEQFLDALAAGGRAVDHPMSVTPSSMDEAFPNINYNVSNADVDVKWTARQNAVTKQEKIVASEALGEARVDQVYADQGWTRLDVDGVPPGKQGKFDRIYESPSGEIHVIESKGGTSNLGSRFTAAMEVAQQGTVQYRTDIILNLKNKLGAAHPLVVKLEDAVEDEVISYILVRQKTTTKSDFYVKVFPE